MKEDCEVPPRHNFGENVEIVKKKKLKNEEELGEELLD